MKSKKLKVKNSEAQKKVHEKAEPEAVRIEDVKPLNPVPIDSEIKINEPVKKTKKTKIIVFGIVAIIILSFIIYSPNFFNKKDCQNIKDITEKEKCQTDLLLSKLDKSLKDCEKLDTLNIRDDCKIKIIESNSRIIINESICNILNDDTLKSKCKNKIKDKREYYKIIVENLPENCNFLTDDNIKRYCNNYFILKAAKEQINKTLCYKIVEDDNLQNYCLVNVCKNISNNNIKEEC